ncbi:flavin reductase [Agrobacterium vitis]|uniref:flavin reductase family protein n=1 Tax=Allorhizobium ampelinum TaxID=3025782 RepID=UPI001F213194|nr:flavin reductase family protein [Allorhizobium ampelinum]MCF1462067.1 flavin reductase [Allorhizobium ampelinum]
MDIARFKLGMRRLASGVSLITTLSDGVRHGLVATAVSSVSGDPPSLLICVNRNASAHGHIERSGIYCVNILSESAQPIVASFSSAIDRDKRFLRGEWQTLKTGAPALVDSLASFDCEVRHALSYATHTIFIADIVATELWDSTDAPLVYLDGRYRQVLVEPDMTPAE